MWQLRFLNVTALQTHFEDIASNNFLFVCFLLLHIILLYIIYYYIFVFKKTIELDSTQILKWFKSLFKIYWTIYYPVTAIKFIQIISLMSSSEHDVNQNVLRNSH
jgi:hypothetical protein